MADLNKIIDDLSSLTVVEAAELSKQLEEKWGVTAAVVAAAPAAGAATSSAPLNAGLNVPDFCATTFQSIKSHHASANAILPPLPPAPTPQSSNQACSHVFRHSNGSSSMPPGGRLPARTREPNSWLRKCERAEPSLPTVFMSVDCARQWAPG